MPKKFTDEEKSRAVRMVHEQRSEYPTLRATCEAVGGGFNWSSQRVVV
ncbi:hypothetical protein [Tessaracoccus lapidicaptus]